MKNKELFEPHNYRLTAIGRFNDKSGNREIFDRQHGRPASVDYTIRFDEFYSVESMMPLLPLEIIEEVQRRVSLLPERFYFSPVEFETEKYKVRIGEVLKRNLTSK
jgi:hypothetical protein